MDARPSCIMHLDMDAFFASVEQLDNPELRGKPVIVGRGDRGVVCAASYEARVFGVRSAIPVAHARRLCPQGIFLPGRRARYSEISRQIMAILGDFSPVVEQASVDEAYLDATGCERLFGPPRDMALALQARILRDVGLSCSVGVAPVKFLAKVASDFRKPGGLTIVEPGDVADFLSVLPVGKIPGVGGKTLARLTSLGVKTCGDVLGYSARFWEDQLGEWGLALHQRARGIGSATLTPHWEAKSSSAENTFERDLADREELKRWLLAQSERVGRDLRRHGWRGRTVTLKLKYEDFRSVTRSHTLRHPTDRDREIFDTACALLDALDMRKKARLIGVGVSNFARGDEQLTLLPDQGQERDSRLDRALDAIRDRHGKTALHRGRLFGKD